MRYSIIMARGVASQYERPTVGTIIGRHYWASEASPTLGCSIEISRDREYGSTLWLARAVSPTNTNFRLTFLLT